MQKGTSRRLNISIFPIEYLPGNFFLDFKGEGGKYGGQ